jgi:hypothetical protein
MRIICDRSPTRYDNCERLSTVASSEKHGPFLLHLLSFVHYAGFDRLENTYIYVP